MLTMEGIEMSETKATQWFNRDGSPCERPVRQISVTTASFQRQESCNRCGGAGGWQGWPGFTCYGCGGTGKGIVRTIKVYTAEKLAALNASQEKRNAKRQEAAEAKHAEQRAAITAWRADNADTLAILRSEARNPEFPQEGGSEFLANLLEQADYRPLSQAQIDAGLAAVQRERDRREQQARQQWIGKVGDRIEFSWTVTRVILLEDGGYGHGYYAPSRYLVLGTDEKGNVVKYIGSGSFPHEGETVKAKATVKSHDTYKGSKQTVIERPKLPKSNPFAEAVAALQTAGA
jgi:hypothetical protein